MHLRLLHGARHIITTLKMVTTITLPTFYNFIINLFAFPQVSPAISLHETHPLTLQSSHTCHFCSFESYSFKCGQKALLVHQPFWKSPVVTDGLRPSLSDSELTELTQAVKSYEVSHVGRTISHRERTSVPPGSFWDTVSYK